MKRIKVKRIFETPSDKNFFFGYFNTHQISSDDTSLIALKCKNIDRVPNPDDGDFAEIGLFSLKDNIKEFKKFGLTHSFNWQQGCLAQFIGPDFSNKIIFNDFDEELNQYISKIYDISKETTEVLPFPIYAVFPCGTKALSIDFERHFWCRRGYSYGNIKNNKKNMKVVPDDGIWVSDFKSKTKKLLISLEMLLEESPISNMINATHYLEHMTISPCGSRFVFLHRWKLEEGGIHSRFYSYDMRTEKYHILNDSGRMSHFCWQDNNQIIGYGGIQNKFNKLRKNKTFVKRFFKPIMPIYKFFVKDSSVISKKLTGDSYININVNSKKIKKIALDLITEDGHPSINPGSHVFITDTYARLDINQKPKLIAYDLNLKKSFCIDELGSIKEFDESPIRCDLHPRVSFSGKLLSIDTMDKGYRGIYVYEMPKL